MTHYIFNESGIIPGIPGTFANCRVDVDEAAGEYTVTPLSTHPAFIPSAQEEAVPQETPAPTEETPVQHLEALEHEVESALAQAEHTEPSPPAQIEG